MNSIKIVNLSKPIEEVALRILQSDKLIRPAIRKWEADGEAYNLILISARHALAASKLAQVDSAFQPSASILSRSCMELGAKALWLLDPDDSYVREARWITHMRHGVNERKKMDSLMGSQYSQSTTTVAEFTEKVAAILPDTAIPPKKLPNLRDMLKSIGHEKKYLLYARSSQDMHGSHFATQVVQQHLGTSTVYGEFVTPGDWSLALAVCWHFIFFPSFSLADRYGFDESIFAPIEVQESFVAAQKEISNEKLSR